MTSKCIGNTKSEFADEYFPRPPPSSACSKPCLLANPFEKLKDANAMGEPELQETFIDIINKNDLVPGLKMGSCHLRSDSSEIDKAKQKLDAAFWRDGMVPIDNKPHWTDQLMPVEFKAWKSGSNCQDPFFDDVTVRGGVTVRKTTQRTKNFGQIISYAELVFFAQHREAVFMPIIVGRICRFLRWDHSGAVVTEAIDYYEDWEFFCDVLWRISQCSDEQLGIDPTAIRLSDSDEEFKAMDLAAAPNPDDIAHAEGPLDAPPKAPYTFKYVRDMFRESLAKEWPRYKLEVPDGETMKYFLVCKPVFCAEHLLGRGTRGYVALDCQTGRFVWLKDAWRAYYLLLEKEGDVLAKLNKAKVPNVPTVVCHGDIQDQTTLTSLVWELKNPPPSPTASGPSQQADPTRPSSSSTSSAKRKRIDEDDSGVDIPSLKGLDGADTPFREDCPLRIHKHYRLVVEEVAMPLRDVKTGEQLVFIILQCIFAHHKAATDTESPILHRDVSGGNILIYPEVLHDEASNVWSVQWSGLLADWEMSKPIADKPVGKVQGRQPERTGTWQYMSVALLSRGKSIEICDELESFLYVLIYHAARYLKSNVSDITVADYLDAFFDQYSRADDGRLICGATKRTAIETGRLMIDRDEALELKFDGPMDNLIKKLLSWFKSHRTVTLYKQPLEQGKGQQQAQARAQMPPPPRPPPDGTLKRRLNFSDDMNLPGQEPDSMFDNTEDDFEPSKKDWRDWKNVTTHFPIVRLLESYLDPELFTWPKDDKVGDRIPANYVGPPLLSGPGETKTTGSSNKRVRLQEKPVRIASAVTLPLPRSQQKSPATPTKKRVAEPKSVRFSTESEDD
ncbi:hypothetical protein L226DRAFT_496191 [Lentinus tigrinus ALCF2SS1-7]|uniref:Fungal-type protein kinase domain-containing protein n=1 Tax=Lentinus tigrinus ALCF2SS1-6 TaxID=1328759 RepID=A0A5C2RLW7_9APHY|nr:hypothetical protein L227DRAFT_558621 [Lentinus tigrinus ALCF2SS1-6]RPD67963.1 hypothetical protein L226DRAFT_496191 [Lentinus tigrinus ALCF2SS1-7]